MSLKQMALVWALALPPTQKFVLMAIADEADGGRGRRIPAAVRSGSCRSAALREKSALQRGGSA
jgi:hypothetical protein